MTDTLSVRRTVLPWNLRVFAAVPLSPAWIGGAIGATWLAVYLAVAWAAGWLEAGRIDGVPPLQSQDLWFTLLAAALMGYLAAASAYGVRGARQTLEKLAPSLALGETELRDAESRLSRFGRGQLLAITGSLFAVAVVVSVTGDPGSRVRVDPMSLWWDRIVTWSLAWIVTRTVTIDLVLSRRLSVLAAQHAVVDLLDLGHLRGLGSRVLSSVLHWSVVAALISLFFLADPFPDALKPLVASLLVALVITAALAPLLPLHRRLVQERARELERVRAALRQRLGNAAADGPFAHLGAADLIAYEGRIASANTWPVDLSTLVRSALYLAVGVGSWLGAALVEKLLESVLRS